ncbi:MAG: TatD family hydrolase [Clostridiales bacterium]|nr:TatD family hydrolase [Clostridiales bacterium]
MELELFDSHCHMDEPRFDGDRNEVLVRMANQKVTGCVCVGSDIETSLRCVRYARNTSQVYAAVGVHPHEAKFFRKEDLLLFESWIKDPKVVALGEIGLDYYYDHSPREVQMQAFLAQLDFAYERDIPVIFHVRDAHGPMIETLKERKNHLPQGVIHCFTGSWESAQEYIRLGFSIGLGGTVTFKNAPKVQRVAREIPLEKLLIETDSPYLSPEPLRGRRNEPGNVFYVAKKIAELKELPIEEIGQATTENAKMLYRII